MPFGQDKAIPVFPLGIIGLDAHPIEVKGGNNFRRRRSAAPMTSLTLVKHIKHFQPEGSGQKRCFLRLFYGALFF